MLGRPRALLALLAAISAGLAVYVGRPWRWFSYHPLLMLLAHLALASAATAAKRERKGRSNTILHARGMLLATALSLGGWYIIYEQKIMLGKPHNTTYHSLAGLATLVSFCGLSLVGVVALHPDFGLLKASKIIRTVHKMFGRAATVVSFAALASGTATIAGNGIAAMLSVLLAVVAWTLIMASPASLAGGSSRHAV